MIKRSQERSASHDLIDLPLEGAGDLPQAKRSGDLEAIGSLDRRRRPPRQSKSWLWPIPLMAFPIGALVGYFSSAEPPVASISVERVDFGEVRLDLAGETRIISFLNSGEEPLWPSSVVVRGQAAAEIEVLADECVGREILAQAQCELQLLFQPAQDGPRRAELRFESNASNGPQSVPLIGVGVRPQLNVEPLEIDFGRQVVARGGALADLRIDNRGTAPLKLEVLDIGGAAADEFLRVSDDCVGRYLAPGSRCRVRLRFVPGAVGIRRATVRVASDAGGEPAVISLLGTGLDRRPILKLDAERVDFGGWPVGVESAAQSINLSNEGESSLEIKRVELADSPGAFSILAESCSRAPVAPRSGCEIQLRFKPGDERSTQSYLVIDIGNREPVRVSLSGIGTAPHARFEPSRLSFGAVGIQQRSAARTLRIANPGSAGLQIGEIRVDGSDAGSFSSKGCSGDEVRPGGACVVEVFFRPRRAGPHRAELLIRHNADDRRGRIRLNGLGAAASLTAVPAELELGNVAAGGASRQRLELRSAGRASLEIRRLRLTRLGSEFEIVEDRCSSTALAPSQFCGVTIVFRPTRPGFRSGSLEIEHSGGTTQVPIRATATD
ncbi:MAG: choice-of-anchor D domain-containing protein [Acidobacteriota bacterium]